MSSSKTALASGAKAGALALVFSVIGVLLLALFAKIFGIGDSLLPIINQVLKALAVIIAILLAVREEKFLAKSVVCAVTFCLLSLLLFIILGGNIHFGQIALDLAITLVVAVLTGVLKARRS